MAKIPKQLYVVAKIKDPGEEAPLGFLHGYEPGKHGFEKKKATQDDWAYNTFRRSFALEQRIGSEWFAVGEDYDYTNGYGSGIIVKKETLLVHPPVIWNNDPLIGFKVLTSISRSSTSNKLWRILDPRGYMFEISTESMEHIIMDGTIKNGLIIEPCIWITSKRLEIVNYATYTR